MFSNSQSNSGSGSGSSTCVMELQPPHHQHHHQDIPKPEPTYNGTGSLTPPNFNPSSSSSTTFTNNNKTFNAHPGEPRSYLDTEPRLVPSSIGLNGVQDEIELEQASGNVLGGTTAATATATEGVGGIEGGDENRDVPPEDATSVVSPPEIWNSSWINVCRVFGTFFSFTILGANDAAYGALIPYERDDLKRVTKRRASFEEDELEEDGLGEDVENEEDAAEDF
ncbi:MAG: autophagy protein [Watsoniomyces obsoletus]|nr:MAG: autophagy protein [Watsoniomyces obsoletus]